MLFSVVFLGFLATGALAGSKYEANSYIDNVLRNYLPNNVRVQSLDPANLPEIKVKVPGKGLLRTFKAKLTHGQLYGLSHVVQRRGDCSAPGWQGGNVTLGCWLALDGLRSHFDVSSKGDSFFDSKKKYSVDLVVKNTNLFVEVSQQKPRSPYVKTLSVADLSFDLRSSKTLDLNSKRWKQLEASLKEAVQGGVRSLLFGPFKQALDLSVQALQLPAA
ncbi:uncharacterized protein LOC135400762 [Ornithodoros turicata]|uniref:uncharacterized protein LOC135400762 n=1 Tax=Ornithodoros turicata TaxID=34597 RepID=UPI003138D8CE